MIRTLAAAGLVLAGLALADDAPAQTWGQPVYVSPHGHVVGGTPLAEVETRSYVNTGRWADGYSDEAYVYVPVPVYGSRYGHNRGYRYGYDRYDRDRYGRGWSAYGHGRYEPRPRPGYRDVWGYNDDRHPASRGWSRERRSHYHDRDCGCGDVYLYDR
ncbi:MAG TPA: hypothetical protein VFF66_04470 [Brevundimonas sp.]|nr:hypothetical protein [Brevundimonas sp.]